MKSKINLILSILRSRKIISTSSKEIKNFDCSNKTNIKKNTYGASMVKKKKERK